MISKNKKILHGNCSRVLLENERGTRQFVCLLHYFIEIDRYEFKEYSGCITKNRFTL